jgi:8-oxo-dGTP pyrophosphatase MutT (NUDIX family)
MVVIQPSSGKVLVVNDTKRGSWFLPRGRKDIGETLEQCALREAYEEVRYFLLLHSYSKGGGVSCAAAHGACAWRRYRIARVRTRMCTPPPSFFPPLTREGAATTKQEGS